MAIITVAPHPLLDLGCFITVFPRPLGESPTPETLLNGLSLAANMDLPRAESESLLREKIRDLLRSGGFKPTGRSKPASEYLLRASSEASLSSINLAVDACNVVSLHTGLPISVIDLDRSGGCLRIALAQPGDSYVFNPSGQVMELAGLLCLWDQDGPIANAVKDSQRTKTSPGTTRTLSVVWGTQAIPGRTADVVTRYRQILEDCGARTEDVAIQSEPAT
ncbi:MAG: phenylalanine--tRNA ligase beta subunit-related protein [Gemmataceae bacterium]